MDLTLFPSLLLYSSLQGIILHCCNCRDSSWCWQWLYWEMDFNEVQFSYFTGTSAFASWKITSCQDNADNFVTKRTDLFGTHAFYSKIVLLKCFAMLLYVYLIFSVWEYCYLEVKWKGITGWTQRWDFFHATLDFYAADVCRQGRYRSFPLESGERNRHLEGSVTLTFCRHLVWVEANPTLASLAVKIAHCSWLCKQYSYRYTDKGLLHPHCS